MRAHLMRTLHDAQRCDGLAHAARCRQQRFHEMTCAQVTTLSVPHENHRWPYTRSECDDLTAVHAAALAALLRCSNVSGSLGISTDAEVSGML